MWALLLIPKVFLMIHHPNPGGLRAGTTVLTQRGMKEAEMEEVADIWLDIVKNPADPAKLADVQQRILSLARRFPLPE